MDMDIASPHILNNYSYIKSQLPQERYAAVVCNGNFAMNFDMTEVLTLEMQREI